VALLIAACTPEELAKRETTAQEYRDKIFVDLCPGTFPKVITWGSSGEYYSATYENQDGDLTILFFSSNGAVQSRDTYNLPGGTCEK
jgi:hypothetical protein